MSKTSGDASPSPVWRGAGLRRPTVLSRMVWRQQHVRLLGLELRQHAGQRLDEVGGAHEPDVLSARQLEPAVARRSATRALREVLHAHARVARGGGIEQFGHMVTGGVIDRDHLQIPRVLAENRGQAGLEEGLLAMRHQDEGQPGGHRWQATP